MPIRLLLALATLLLPAYTASAEDVKPRPPHIVVMLADDLGWGDVGFHGGGIPTPHLDGLARAGTRLEHFYVQPVCTPTRGALMTGRYPMRLGLQCGVIRPWAMHGLPLDERILPVALKGAGYRTAIVGKWHLGHNKPAYLPTRRGFDIQYGHYNGALDYFTHIRDGGHDWHRNDQRSDDKGYATELTAKEAERVIAEHDKTQPLFLYVPFTAPHTPLQAPKETIAKFAAVKDRNRRVYAAMVSCMDDAVGRIVKQLKTSGYPMDNTLIFFASDNGGLSFLGSNGQFRSQKGRLYEGGVRSPAVMVWKGTVPAGRSTDAMMHIVDLYPTLLKRAGVSLKQEKPIDGRDQWPSITEGKPSAHEAILINVNPFCGAIRVGKWKLVWNGQARANDTQAPAEETWELFNLEKDPGEKNNVAAHAPRILAEMKARLKALGDQAAKPNIPPNKPPRGFKAPTVWGEAR